MFKFKNKWSILPIVMLVLFASCLVFADILSVPSLGFIGIIGFALTFPVAHFINR